jgi:hypothetical protein
MAKGLIRMDEALMVQVFLEIATALRSQDQFVALGGSRGIGDRAIQFPTRASDFLVAADDLDEA